MKDQHPDLDASNALLRQIAAQMQNPASHPNNLEALAMLQRNQLLQSSSRGPPGQNDLTSVNKMQGGIGPAPNRLPFPGKVFNLVQ